MARLTVEDKWWSDPRREKLAGILGDAFRADACALRAWRLAQEFWGHGLNLVPKEIFETLPEPEALIECGLAVVKDDGFIYIRGSSQYLSWLHESRESASRGGKKSAKVRKAKFGSAVPKNARNTEATTEPPTEVKPKPIEPSVSVSVLGSVSEKKENAENASRMELAPIDLQQELIPKQSKFKEPTKMKMKAFIATYAGAYKARYNSSPEGLRDKGVIGKIGHWVESVSEERACELVQVYLQIDYRPINDSCHDLWQFFRHLNRIGNALSTGVDPNGIDWSKVFGNAA